MKSRSMKVRRAHTIGLILTQLVTFSVVVAQTSAPPSDVVQATKAPEPVVIFSLEPARKGRNPGTPFIDPIAVMKGGKLTKPPMYVKGEDEANKAFARFSKQYYKRGIVYPFISHGSYDGNVTVGEIASISCESWAASTTLSHTLPDDRPRLVTTSSAGLGLHADLDIPVTDMQRSSFRKLAAGYFQQRHLSNPTISKLKIENLYSVYLSPSSPQALVGEVAIRGRSAIYRLFMLADWDEGDGPYNLELASYHVSKDVEDGTDSVVELFLDHADLDNDGTDEIVTTSYYYESWDYTIYKKEKNGRWQSVYRGAGGGC